MKRFLIFSVLAFASLMLYQNCGNISLTPNVPIQEASVTSMLQGEFCAGVPNGDRMQLQNFFFINLTAKSVASRLIPDSDIDGIPDETEVSNSALGFNFSGSRSSGILDGICFSQGGNNCVPSSCDQSILSLGLTNCDAVATSSSTLLTGVDTDLDGLPDFIEILKGLDPIRGNLDEDNDMKSNGEKSNIDEVQKGLDPKSNIDLDESLELRVSTPLQTITGECGNQDRYEFAVNRFPLLDIEENQNPKFPELSHLKNENVMLAFYVTHPLDRTKKGKIFYQVLKVQKDAGPPSLNMKLQDFKLLGDFDLP